ncbi:MAG: cytochrome P450 [Gammaproteobacteria bacterium]|jgi:cytochrome P450
MAGHSGLPGPRGHWLLGSLPEYRRDPLGFLARCAADYGALSAFRLGPTRYVLVNEPGLIEQVLQPRTESLRKPRDVRKLRVLLGNGLLTSEGEAWRRQRRLLQSVFHNERIAACSGIMLAESERLLAEWVPGQVRDIHRDMSALALRVAGRSLFGADVGGRVEEIGRAMAGIMPRFEAVMPAGRPLPFSIPFPGHLGMRREIRALQGLIDDIVEERAASGPGDDLLWALLTLGQREPTAMTAGQLRDEVMTLLLAGHETTALALTWSIHLLARDLPVAARVAAEARGLARPEDAPVEAVLIGNVVRESLRLYPPTWAVGREVTHPFPLAGRELRPGTQILMLQHLMHRSARYYRDPEQFLPDRWTDEFRRHLPKYAYFPFGGGPRFCIGSHFAMLEAMLVLAAIYRKFTPEAVPGHEAGLQAAVTLRPRSGVRVILRPV